MKRLKTSRRDFLKGSAFITGSVAGAGLFTGANPELEAAVAQPAQTSAERSTAPTLCGSVTRSSKRTSGALPRGAQISETDPQSSGFTSTAAP